MELKNDDILIRTFTENDIQKKIEWINNPQNHRYLHYDIPLNFEKTLSWFKNKDNTIREDCVIIYRNKPVGLIGLLSIDKINQKAEIYISMGEEQYKRKGIATIAMKLLLKYAFWERKLNKIYLNVDAKNEIACHLYEKIGFRCEGIMRDELYVKEQFIDRVRYAMIKTDFIG